MTEEELISQLLNPATRNKAFTDLVKMYSKPLYWHIRNIVLDHDEADDILQNVFLKAWTNLSSFEKRSKISTWLYKIAVNQCLDYLRKQRNSPKITSDVAQSISEHLVSDPFFDGEELEAKLREGVSSLPDAQRVIFNMRYFEEMKYKDIAQVLGKSEGTIKSSYHIAVQKLLQFFHLKD